jgi:predicted O-methyltransferase YrrM
MLQRLRSAAAVLRTPPYVTPGHFYSPVTSPADRARALSWDDGAPGVDLREAGQEELARQLRPVLEEPLPGPRYQPRNPMFGPADAAVYRAMLRHLRPARVIEAGSGWSTAVALDELPGLPGLEITCIEPYPQRLESVLRPGDPVTLHRQPAEDFPLRGYRALGPGDILFIDSTHVLKPGGDVAWLYLHVLPRLAPGVIVHVHDIFWPFTYPARWIRERRDWTEAYVLHALLSGSSHFGILLFSSWLWHCRPGLVPQHLQREEPGSVWLRRLP